MLKLWDLFNIDIISNKYNHNCKGSNDCDDFDEMVLWNENWKRNHAFVTKTKVVKIRIPSWVCLNFDVWFHLGEIKVDDGIPTFWIPSEFICRVRIRSYVWNASYIPPFSNIKIVYSNVKISTCLCVLACPNFVSIIWCFHHLFFVEFLCFPLC